MKKFYSLCASLFAATSVFAVGDIYEIRPCTGIDDVYCGDSVTYPVTTKDKPMQSGSDVYFNVRLISRDNNASGTDRQNFFKLAYRGIGSETNDAYMNPLKLGIFLGDQRRWAKLVNVRVTPSDYTSRTPSKNLTDLVFAYHIEPGDFGLPVELALDGWEHIDAGDSAKPTIKYQMANTDKWAVEYWKENAYDSDAEFLFAKQSFAASSPDSDALSGNYSLTKCGFYVQTVEFENESYEIQKTETSDGWKIVASAPIGETKTLYVWSEDETAVVVTKGTDEYGKSVAAETVSVITNTSGTKLYGNRQIATVNIIGGAIYGNFEVYGVESNKTANLVLSARKGYAWNSATGERVDDYVTVPVKCTEPPEPSLTLSRELDAKGEELKTCVVTSNYNDKVTTLTLTLQGNYDGEMTVTVAPVLKNPGPYKTNDIVRVSEQKKEGWEKDLGPISVTFKKGETTKPIYVYGMGANKDYTVGAGNEINFKITDIQPAAAKSFIKKTTDTFLYFSPAAPVVLAPEAGHPFTVTGDETYELKDDNSIVVEDNFTDKQDTNTGYVVYWKYRASDKKFEELKDADGNSRLWRPNSDSVLQAYVDGAFTNLFPAITYADAPDDDGLSYFYIIAPNGEMSAVTTVNVTFKPAPVRTVAPVALNVENPDFVDEGTNISIKVQLGGEAYSTKEPVYAFLQLADTNLYARLKDTRNLAIEGAVSYMQIKAKATESAVSTIVIDDGESDGTDFEFEAILCTTRKFSTNNVVKTFKSVDNLIVTAQNVYPEIESVTIGDGTPGAPDPNGEIWLTDLANVGAETKFSFIVNDPSDADLEAEGEDAFKLQYTVKGGGTNATGIVYGNPNTNSLVFTFNTKDSDATLTLWTFDKDMDSKDRRVQAAVKRVVHFAVSDRPYVQVVTAEGDLTGTFEEDAVPGDGDQLKVLFSHGGVPFTAKDDLVVQLTVSNIVSSASDNPGTLTLSGAKSLGGGVYTVTVPAYQSSAAVTISSADGTADSRFKIVAAVITDKKYTSEGVAWNKYFENASKVTQGTFRIRNAAPHLKVGSPLEMPGDLGYMQGIYSDTVNTNGYSVSASVMTKAIKWNVSDVDGDMGNDHTNLLVTWSVAGGELDSINVTNKTEWHSFYPDFSGLSGTVKVSVTVTDKDDQNSTTSATWLFEVAKSKQLITAADGPANSESALVQKYVAAGGLGEGHVYYDSLKIASATGFELTWNCGLVKTVNCYAWGYKVGDVDNGYLADGQDIPLDTKGNKTTKAKTASVKTGYYTYPDTVYDSFLYCWLQKVSTSTESSSGSSTTTSSGMKSTIFGTLMPERTLAAVQRAQVSMPSEEDTEGGYTPIMMEAIFSKEKLPSDNMGDINADWIPDAYVSTYKFGVINEDGEIDGDDTTKFHAYNDDEDYLPIVGTAAYAQLIPGLSNTWVTAGKPFTARLEVRGWGDCLNDAPALAKVINVKPDVIYADPAVNTNSTLTALEWDAYVQAGKPEGWSPERPTDPTLADTDEDGLPDGYEYYIWYKAHVGYWDNDTHTADALDATDGVHKYLTGRCYNAADPTNPTTIDPDTIASLYDPLTAIAEGYDTLDTDCDGIPDTMEILLGTNPFDFDTDGDGLPDGFESVYTATDPLKYATDDQHADGTLNPDNDAMAAYDETMNVIGIPSGSTTKYYCTLATNKFETKISEAETPCWRLEVWPAEDAKEKVTNVYFTTVFKTQTDVDARFYKNAAGKLCLIGDLDKNTWVGREIEGTNSILRGTSVRLPKGSLFDSVSACQYRKQTLSAAPGEVYVAYPYNGTYGRGRKTTLSAGREIVVDLSDTTVRVMHYHVYQTHGFDPRTGWKDTGYESMAYTHMDEFLSLVFWYNAGTIEPQDLVPTVACPMETIWKKYTTSPLSADTDSDAMPDGWEFYVMSESGEAAPDTEFSPIKDGSSSVDADSDGLTFPEEYSGIESSAQYGMSPSYPLWRNKLYPTDPWDEDTDGDGMYDGPEGGVLGVALENKQPHMFEAGVVNGSFRYNDSGAAGGMLNPLSVDTDLDGLPDPWEVEFYGTYTAANPQTSVTTKNIEVTTQDGTVISSTTNETTVVADTGAVWNMDGMDGTVPDSRLDYDSDGLANWQEYVVGAMRCWRYDDPITSWGVNTLSTNEIAEAGKSVESWGKFWYDRLINTASPDYNPTLANGYLNGVGAYFTCCQHKWDQAYGGWYMYRDGIGHDLMKDYKSGGMNRYTAQAMSEWGTDTPYDVTTYAYPKKYICCEPRRHDTDFDGMDDYYELFHGMNPLLGQPGEQDMHMNAGYDTPYDVVYDAYLHYAGVYTVFLADGLSTPQTALNNWWRNGKKNHATTCLPSYKEGSASDNNQGYDFIANPWLNGIAGADPDGDNIVNQEESIMPKVQAASTYHHTDPTPLWMTDTSYTNSLTRKYYRLDPLSSDQGFTTYDCDFGNEFVYGGEVYKFSDRPGFYLDMLGGLHFYVCGIESSTFAAHDNWWFLSGGWMFSFEENEGYDSDHDFLSDYEEAQGKTKNASNAQDHDDPIRRQAMYFNGKDAFLQTPVESSETVPLYTLTGEARQNFLYFTVECWAKPDAESVAANAGLKVLVARSIWADNSSAADEQLMRRNFLIGVKNGRWYACFDGSSTVKDESVQVGNGPQATTDWTHVAATYDGTSLKLYVNGTCQGSQQTTSIQPEHGVNALAINAAGEIQKRGGTSFYGNDCISITVGAMPKTRKGLIYDYAWRYRSYTRALANPAGNPFGLASQTKFGDYEGYYAGYVDEVRIWDGARSAADILSDCENRTRYTTELAEENRQAVYAQWSQGGTRAESSSVQLPPQLMYHWAFDHLAGAVLTNDLIKVPAGFNTDWNMTNAKARWSRPSNWVESCWANSAVKSTVYTDNSWVPWINNTVSHLPRFDLTTLDSVYWSEDYAGATSALTNGYTSFSFPRSNEVYSRWTQQCYSDDDYYDSHYDPDFLEYNTKFARGLLTHTTRAYTQKTRFNVINGYEANGQTNVTTYTDNIKKLQFAARDRNTVGDDLLPMGGAYPRRISVAEGGMWDAKRGESAQASDAWAQTGGDADGNGLPDWWEEYARENYGEELEEHAAIGWDTTLRYDGVLMPAYQAYLRDLAKGLVKMGDDIGYPKDAEGNCIYADTRDADCDGLPDWWEELYHLDATVDNADDDPDNDGLSNYQEYLLGEVYFAAEKDGGFDLANKYGVSSAKLDPTLAYSASGQAVPDYYRSYSDRFVSVVNKSSTTPHFWLNEYFGEMVTDHDFMEDWWENQYDYDYTSMTVYDPLDDKDGDGWSTWAECRSALWGNSFSADLISKWTGTDSSQYVICRPQPIVGVRATYYGKQDISGKQLVVRTTSGQTQRTDATFVVPSSLDGQTKYIGPFAADTVMHGHLSPGLLNANSIIFNRAQVNSEKTYMWNCDWYKENAPEDTGWTEGSYIANGATVYGYLPWSSCDRVKSGSFDDYKEDYKQWPHIELEGGDFTWESFVQTVPTADLASAKLMIDGTTEFGWVDCTTGEYEFDMSKFTGEGTVDEYVFNVTYTSRLGHEWPQTVYLSDTKELETTGTVGIGDGYVREGKNTIEAFMDLDEDGAYTAGEPYGVVQNVDVGWHKTPVVTIELKDTSHIVPRFDVSSGDGDSSGSSSDGEASGTDSTGLTKTIQIRRKSINDEATTERLLLTKTLVLDSRSYLTEADVLAQGKFDLDSKWLAYDWEKLGYDRADIEKAQYEISEKLTDANGNTSNVVLKTFANTFNSSRAVPTAISPLDDAPVYSSAPTFSFTCEDETMTAYRIQIRKASDKTVVYDGDITVLPGREPDTVGTAVCNVTPNVHVGLELEPGATYEWRVALYNAKYPDDEATAWSATADDTWAKFQMDVDNANRYPRLATGYGRKTLAVRYYGPATNLTADTAIYVEAFEGADFRGQPAARAKVALADGLLDSRTDITTTNAVLKGLAPGKWFFRAFIDFNGNGKREDWESWGYVNNVGKGMKAIYNPIDVEVTASTSDWNVTDVAQYTLFIEDCDTDQNEIPDCLEPPDQKDSDGDGLTDDDEKSLYGTDPYTADTDGDGMPDGYEVWSGLDPTSPDDDVCEDGDVMAMATSEDGETLMKHAQVYAAYGFDPTTAVSEGGANTVPFTAIEKYGVISYLDELGLIPYDHAKYSSGEDYVNRNRLWDQYALKADCSDFDGDGVPDGWELYTMFGPAYTNGVAKLADVSISPWNEADGAKTSPGDAKAGLDADSRLTLLGEFNGSKATDPWVTDTDGDNVIDRYYHDYMLWDSGADADGDGLSNYAEYLISKVFKFAQLDPDNKKTNGSVVDYFRKEGELYFGEMFTDHDQVDDTWEQGYATFANRYVYDPARDDDGDGWCNFSEAKAGTHPGAVASPGVGYALPEYPVPVIAARVVYSGKQTLSGSIVFQCWSQVTDAGMTGEPDATWTTGDAESQTNATRYLGINPGKECRYWLGTGTVSPGTVCLRFRDMAYETAAVYGDSNEIATTNTVEAGYSKWYPVVMDNGYGELYTSVSNMVRVKVGAVDYATGEITIDFGCEALQGYTLDNAINGTWGSDTATRQSGAYTNADRINLSRSYVLIEWTPVKITATGNTTYYLSAATGGKGHVREGLNKFVVFCDMDEDGAYDPGEPFGFVRNVDVGWQGGALEVELTETSPIFARIDLKAASGGESSGGESSGSAVICSDRQVWQDGCSTVTDIGDGSTESQNLCTLMGVTTKKGSDELDLTDARLTRIRVLRVLVNGATTVGETRSKSDGRIRGVVLDKYLDLGTRSYLHEGDFLTDGSFDCDWPTMQEQVVDKKVYTTSTSFVLEQNTVDATNVTYAIMIGEGEVGNSNLVFRCVVNKTFDYAGSRDASSTATHVIRPVIDTTQPQDYVYGARPKFRFAMQDSYGNNYNSYTAFKIRIGNIETDLQDLPPKDAAGWYEWTLDEALGARLPGSGTYKWQVALYNAKFQGSTYQGQAVSEWSEAGTFTVDMNNQQDMNDHGYSSVAAAVKYAGPSAVLDEGTVIVQAFETADFAGNPAGQCYVTDDIDETASVVANAVIRGLPQTGTYYLRAFIDMDGDRELDDFESWGAASEAVTLTADVVTVPTVGVWIEDADTDGDWIPDAYEYAKKGDLTTLTGTIIGGDQIVFSGTVGSTGTAGISTGLSGASLTIFQNKSFITTLLDVDDVVSIDAIRAAVEKKVNPTTVKITALTLAPDGSKVTLSVAAEVTDSIAGELLGKLYNITSGDTAKVTVHVYTKTSLATATWTEIGPKDAKGQYTGFAAEVGRDDVEIDVDLGDYVDMASGFYKIVVVQ